MKLLISLFVFVAIACAALTTGAQVASADEVCRRCPFDCRYLGISRKHCGDEHERRGQCCVGLDNDGQDQLADFDSDRSDRSDHSDHSDRSNRVTCPAGMTPSEQSCSQNERRRGCHDARQPDGHGCVTSSFR